MENELFFFSFSLFFSPLLTCFKTAQNIYRRLLHTLLVYADFFFFLYFSPQTENCTVNVDVHNFFVLKKSKRSLLSLLIILL